jgi:hypothetical protein
MQAKSYKITSMKSPETWVMINRNGKKNTGSDLEHFRHLYKQSKQNKTEKECEE